MYTRRDQQNALSPWQMGHSPMNPMQSMMPQAPHFGGYAGQRIRNACGFAETPIKLTA